MAGLGFGFGQCREPFGGNMNFIELFNMVSIVARPAHKDKTIATSMEDALQDIGLDSLDGLVMLMYLCELYGIPDDDETKDWHPTTVQEVYDLLMSRKTMEPTSVEEARKAIQ
jgi:acyl carrier protein